MFKLLESVKLNNGKICYAGACGLVHVEHYVCNEQWGDTV